jgi:hypothetical protein
MTRKADCVWAVDGFEHGGIRPGPGFDYIEEVAGMDEDNWFLVDDIISRFEEVVIDLFSRMFISLSGLRWLNAAKPKWMSAIWMSFI